MKPTQAELATVRLAAENFKRGETEVAFQLMKLLRKDILVEVRETLKEMLAEHT